MFGMHTLHASFWQPYWHVIGFVIEPVLSHVERSSPLQNVVFAMHSLQ